MPEIKKNQGAAGISRFLPILSWLPKYNRSWLMADALAGLTLWGLVVPEGMAYAGIAGLPPQAGLYTLVTALLVYALMGTSRHLVAQATSASAALLASSVTAVLVASAVGASSDPDTYQAYASAFVLVTGVVFLAAGLARLGFVTQFLSKPVMDGFVLGLATFVAVGQLNKLFGVPKPEGNVIEKLIGIFRELPQANWATFVVGASALALLFLLPRWNKKIPAGLAVLFGAIVLSAVLNLEENFGVEAVGLLPQGLPSISLPAVPFTAYLTMILPAIGVFLVAFSEALGVAHEFGEKHGYEVDADQELNAHAVANVASALFGGMIAAGSMSASAVKEGAGARTQVSNLVAWVVTVITLLFLTPLFAPLPEAVLAALIIHAVWHIIASRKLRKIWMESRVEFWFGLLALAGVVFIDVLQGMIIGLVASLVFVIYRTSRPHIASLGRVPNVPGAYSDLKRHPENRPVPGVLIVRLDTQLYYANALTVRAFVNSLIAEGDTPPRVVIFDAAAQEEIDLTSTEVLRGLVKELHASGIAVYVAEVHAPVLEHGRKTGLIDFIGEDHVFRTVDMAVAAAEKQAAQDQQTPASPPGSRVDEPDSSSHLAKENNEMSQQETISRPLPAFAGGTRAITTTPIVGTPRREYAEVYVPGEEALEDGEMRVIVLGSGNPWTTRAQASGSILVEIGNPERDLLVFDLGSGSLANYASLKLPVNLLDKVFFTHLHADHTADLITLSGSYSKVGRADGPVKVWGPSGTEPRLGTRHFVEAIEEALAWDTAAGSGVMNPLSMKMQVTEFDFSKTQVVYEANGVKITSFPVIHALSGAVGYRVDFAGLTFVHSGDTRAGWPLVRACEGNVDLLIHECFPPAKALAAASGLSIERATMALNAAHTSPKAAAKVFGLVKPRMAGLWHTLLSPQVIALVFEELDAAYDGPVVQTQDLTVFNLTKEAVIVRQAQVLEQLPPIPGVPRMAFTPALPAPPAWWAEALIPFE